MEFRKYIVWSSLRNSSREDEEDVGRFNRINVYVPSRLVSFFISDCWRSIYILYCICTQKINIWTEVYERLRRRKVERDYCDNRHMNAITHSSDCSADDFVFFRWKSYRRPFVSAWGKSQFVVNLVVKRVVSVSQLRLHWFTWRRVMRINVLSKGLQLEYEI
jgi:hypothetical protein